MHRAIAVVVSADDPLFLTRLSGHECTVFVRTIGIFATFATILTIFRREGSPAITCWPPRWLATSPRSSFCCNDHYFRKRSAFSRQSANFRREGTPAITCWLPRWPRFHQHLLVGLFCILRFGNWTVDFNCSRIPRTFSHNYTPPSLMQSSQWIILKI